MGKYLYSFGEYGLWEDIRPIGLPVILGVFQNIVFSEILAVLFGAGCIILVYLIGLSYGKKAALLSSILVAVSPLFFFQTSLIMTTIPSTFFVLLSFYLYTKKNHFFTIGFVVGLATLFRFPQMLALICFTFLIFLTHSKNRIKSILSLYFGFLCALTPFLLFNLFLYRPITNNFFDALFRPFLFAIKHQSNPFHQGNIFFYMKYLIKESPLFLFSLVSLLHIKKTRKILIFIVPYLLYFSFITNKQPRFMLSFLPFISILTGFGIVTLYKRTNPKKKRKIWILCSLVFTILLIVPINKNIESYKNRSQFEDPLVSFFHTLEKVDGFILTTHPTISSYTHNLFVPMYDNPKLALETFDHLKDDATHIFYFPDFYPCTNAACKKQMTTLQIKIEKHELVASQKSGMHHFYLYKFN